MKQKLYFAPMEGVTGYVFRNAYAACYGGVDAYFTPFISNPVLNQIEKHDVLPEHNEGLQVIPQILTNKANIFLRIAATLKDYGYTSVNFNLGCPSGTVVAKGRGCGALREPKELDRLLDGIFEVSPLPVSVKCRIGISSEVEWEDLLEVLLKYPITELTIHPRLQKEFYNGNVHMDAFRLAYDRILNSAAARSGTEPGLRLCYNGDIRTPEELRKLLQEFPGLHAVMLGRGILWNPQLPEQCLSLVQADNQEEAEGASGRNQASSPAEKKPDLVRLRRFLNLLYDGYREEMDREGPALMKLKELWKYLMVFTGSTPGEMRPLWKTRTLAEYRDVVTMLLG